MKKLAGDFLKTGVLSVISIALLGSTSTAFGDPVDVNSNSYYAFGRVVDVEPIVRSVSVSTPREECTVVTARRRPGSHRRDDQYPGSKLVGALLGGVIGNQFGGGRGRTALTVLGALAGAGISERSADRNRRFDDRDTVRYRRSERCSIVDDIEEVERVDGYVVTYRYQGRSFTRTTKTHPGKRVPIRIEVVPVSDHGEQPRYVRL